jgi:monovalent cation/proton antiporter MnhG/PhaG subunit
LALELLAAAGIVVGVAFMFVASLGLLRFPDFYLRVHAPTKAATLGLFALVAALLAAVPEVREVEALLAALFIGATIPVSAHILLRGAYRSGLRPSRTLLDEYGGSPSAKGGPRQGDPPGA